jgi:hypothetical protein
MLRSVKHKISKVVNIPECGILNKKKLLTIWKENGVTFVTLQLRHASSRSVSLALVIIAVGFSQRKF